jgi:predicted metalloprotease with PDZ domain
LHLTEEKSTVADTGFTASRNFDGPMIVTAVTAGSEAERAGLQTGNTILEINGNVPGEESVPEIERLAPGDAIAVKIRARRGGERELKWKVGSRDEISYVLKNAENVTAERQARRAAWLKGETETPQAVPAH